MIITEQVTILGREYIRTYSDAGCFVVRDGEVYTEAIDPLDSGRTYTEGEIIPAENTQATEADYIAALNRLGVSE